MVDASRLLHFLASAKKGTVPATSIAAGAPLHVGFCGDGEKTGNGIDIAGLTQRDGCAVRGDDALVVRVSP